MSSKVRSLVTGAVLLAGTVIPLGAPAVSASSGDLGKRLAAACARVPAVETRVHQVIARLEGGADVRGSLAWFQVQIDRATAATRPKLAAALTQRKAVLTGKLALLHQQQVALDKVAAICASRGL
jgi:hypothetical protein